MPKDKSPDFFNEAAYADVIQWIKNNPHDTRLTKSLRDDLQHFKELSNKEKEALQTSLLHLPQLPKVIQQFLPDYLTAVPVGALKGEIGSHLDRLDSRSLARSSKHYHGLFQQQAVFDRFLERVAYGQQDKAEQLFTKVYQTKEEKIQETLLHQGTFTDYSGRKFECSAYEYAYWAKDSHMCRMLERYMSDETKAIILERVQQIENNGLNYTQNGKKHCTRHFNLEPLKTMLKIYIEAYNLSPRETREDWEALDRLWRKVGLLQRDVPAHIAQEYCHPDRTFDQVVQNPNLIDVANPANLKRQLNFYNWSVASNDWWFSPRSLGNSGLGSLFAMRGGVPPIARGGLRDSSGAPNDLLAIESIDKARTNDLKQSLENLATPSASQAPPIHG